MKLTEKTLIPIKDESLKGNYADVANKAEMDNNVKRKGSFMKIKNAITITALSVLILTGCGTKKAIEEEGNLSETEVDEIEVNENEDSTEQLAYPYNEIAEYFSEWELPKEGILPKNHEAYYGLTGEVVVYESGYIFGTEAGKYLGRFHGTDYENTPVPTEEQAPGLVMGIISEVASDLTNRAEQYPHLEEGNLDAEYIGEFLPFITLKFEEVVKYSVQMDLHNISNEILMAAKYMKNEIEVGVSEENLKELNIAYSEMVDKIFQLGEAVEAEDQL